MTVDAFSLVPGGLSCTELMSSTGLSGASGAQACELRDRLNDALADARPRRHELDVLRLYLEKQGRGL